LVIAAVVVAASAHDNAVGITLLDKVATDTDTVEKALVDQGTGIRRGLSCTARSSAPSGIGSVASRWTIRDAVCRSQHPATGTCP
jgi:hypothetical protein